MSANNILSNCTENCHNDDSISDVNDIEVIRHTSDYYCNAKPPDNHCLSLTAQLLTCTSLDQRSPLLELPPQFSMETYDRHSVKSFYNVWHIQCTIIVTLIAIALARAIFGRIGGNNSKSEKYKIWLRYLLEFLIITLPAIVSVNIANSYVEYIVACGLLALILIMWRTKCWQRASDREFEFGRRPSIFTLMRSTINFLTALCILAIDFEVFPTNFRKTRRYGVGLMDVGIGLFIFSMGLVSSRPRKFYDFRKMAFTVSCLMVLGLLRTIVITAIEYHQDEHEYGAHLNAFFTLGFTKLLATCFSFIARSKKQLLSLGLAVLFIHEFILQCGIWKYVMDPDTKRIDFLSANREGIFSLLGFVGLFLLSQYLGQWLQSTDVLSFGEIKNKFQILCLITVGLWSAATALIFLTGIARVTCNMGYVTWILAIAVTMCTLYLLVFDLVLDTLKPVNKEISKLNLTELDVSKTIISQNSKIPLVMEAVNYNGLTYFLLANILTGCINMFLEIHERTSLEIVMILFVYMFITTTFCFILYRFQIRIA